MTNIFRIDSPFMRIMTKLFDMISLNLVFLICCLPVVTIGASCTALHTVVLKTAAGEEPEEPYAVKCFVEAFRKNFKQSTVSWIIMLIAGIFLYVDSLMAAQMGTGELFVKLLLGIASVLYFLVALYIFPIQARYDNTIHANLKNALLLAVRHFPKTILLALTVIVPAGLLLYGSTEIFAMMIVFILLFGASVIAGIQARIIWKIFRNYEENGS